MRSPTRVPTHTPGVLFKYKEVILLILIIIITFIFFGQRPPPICKPVASESLETVRFVENNLHSIAQDDPRLIKYVRYRYMTPPSKEEYNLKNPDSSSPHTDLIKELFKNKRNGVFIESGANDGDGRSSNTLKLERELGWTGILIECNPTVVPYLKSTHRRAWVAGVCLSTGAKAAKFNFSNPVSWTYSGRLGKPWDLPVKTNWTFFDVESVPLYTIAAAVQLTDIDFWSLDVEGSEIKILKSIPFDKIKIKVIICEIYFFSSEERLDLDNFMKTKGFIVYPHTFTIDKVYVHESFAKDIVSEKSWMSILG